MLFWGIFWLVKKYDASSGKITKNFYNKVLYAMRGDKWSHIKCWHITEEVRKEEGVGKRKPNTMSIIFIKMFIINLLLSVVILI